MRTPANLSPNARKLWRDTTRKYELATHELLTLEQACRELTLVERMEDDIRGLTSLTTVGSMGQPVVSELVREVRQHRATFTALLKALKLPDDDGAVQDGARSSQARDAAMARWGHRGTA